MSFLWGKSKSDTDVSRARQIADLKASFPSIKQPNNDDSSFELSFELDRQYNTLRIWLPSDFPSNKPVLQVVGSARHPWLDQYKRVSGCEKLTYWDKKTSSLRDVVEVTLSELRRAPAASQLPQAMPRSHGNQYGQYQPQHHPQQQKTISQTHPSQQYQQYMQQRPPSHSSPLMPHQTQGISNHPSHSQPHGGFQQPTGRNIEQGYVMLEPHGQHRPGSNKMTTTPIGHNQQQITERRERPVSERFQISLPTQPKEFPELKTLQVSQLERLLKDDVALKCHANGLECVETLRSMRNDLCKSNSDDAKRNMKKKDDNRTEEEEILILQNNLRGAVTSYKDKLAQYQSRHVQSKDSVVSQVKSYVQSLDDRTDDFAQRFVGGEGEVNSFLQQYLQERTEYHKLKLLLERAA